MDTVAMNDLPLIVSVDDHVVEPPTLWTSRLSSKQREAGPRVVRERLPSVAIPGTDVGADVWHYEDAQVPLLRAFVSVGLPPEETDLEPTTYDDIRPGCFEIEARLRDMDEDGVEASVCFPNSFVRFCGQRFLESKDKDLAIDCVKAYNDWMIEEWAGSSEGRLIPNAIIPLWDVSLAVEEIERNAARGCRSVCFSEIPARLNLPSMYSGYWEPFFAMCAETQTVINLHIGSSSNVHTTSLDAPQGVRASNQFGNSAFSLTDWLMCGVFVRHPSLKVAFSEGQAGWIPYLTSRLDTLWSSNNVAIGFTPLLPELPSSYLKDHVFACVFDDPMVSRVLDLVGEDNICFETDYPHPDGTWPHSRNSALKQTESLSTEQRDKILRWNAAELFQIERVLKQEAVTR